MKRLIIITVLILTHYIGISQTAPEWTKKLPNPSNNTFYYCSITGLGNNYNEALNDAYNKLHRIIDEKLGTTIIGRSSMDNQGSVSYYAVDGQTHTIKTYKACEWPKAYEKSNHWEFLFQVAEAGNITVYFDNFNDCQTMLKDHSRDWKAVGLSLIPGGGWGELYKGQIWGWAVVGSELVLASGGLWCYFIGLREKAIMDNPEKSINEKELASSRYDNVSNLQPCLYVGALAIHGLNLIVAYVIDDKKQNHNWSFIPTLMPTNESLAVGIGINYKF